MIIFLTIVSKSFGQLVGTYSIGGINPDYSNIYKALNDVSSKGVSGAVVFNIRPGTYSGFSIGAIPKLMYPDSIIFQSETHDSTDVVISGSIDLTSASGITLRWLTIEEPGISSSIAVQFDGSYHCNILNCLINTPNSVGDIYDSQSAISIRGGTSVRIEKCQLIGKGSGFYVVGKGLTQIINCNVASTGRYSIATNFVENLSIQGSYLQGSTYIDFNSFSGRSIFKNNVLIGKEIDLTEFNLVEGNEFICLDSNRSTTVACDNIRNNYFNHNVIFTAKVIVSNKFKSNVRISRSDNVQFIGNTLSGDLKFVFCNNVHMSRNVIHGTTYLSFADYARVDNNIFYDVVTNAISSNNKFYYNNFVDSALLNSELVAVDAQFNNFSQELSVPISSKIKYNNYYPCVGFWDQHPYHYNPEYKSSSNSRASNPLLIGKGELVNFVTNDIDGVLRPQNPTIGASEICVSSFGEMKKVVIVCGDDLMLRRCDADSLSGYRWYPSIGLKDTISSTPIAKPIASTMYYLVNSIGLILDSVMIEVENFSVEGADTFNLGSCGALFLLSKNFNPSASYRWSPAKWLSDSTIYNPLSSPKIATTYVQKISIPGCGFFVDSTFLDLNPSPTAIASHYPKELEVTFYNYSSCADRYLWKFGDGLQSTDEAPVHNYDTIGVYDVSLIASNQFGDDTFNFSVETYLIGIKNVGMKGNNFAVYPNPSSGLIHIDLNKMAVNTTFSVYDFLGQLIHTKQLNRVASFDYNLPEAKGIYIIQFIQEDGTLYSRKVIKK